MLAALLAAVCLCLAAACTTISQETPGPGGTPEPAAESGTRPLLVLMYHNLLKDRKSKYSVTPDAFREDLILLKESGYQSVSAGEVIAFAGGGGTLPERPVLITFDDGHYNNLFYAKDILREEGFTALVSVIGKYSESTTETKSGGNLSHSFLTWTEIREMAESGVFEIGNHSYGMHEYKPRFGATQRSGESDKAYRSALARDAETLQNLLADRCGVTPSVYTIPFGEYRPLTLQILAEEGFGMLLTCNEGVSTVERGNPESLRQVKRYNRNPDIDMRNFLTKLENREDRS